jgi:inner membrane protein
VWGGFCAVFPDLDSVVGLFDDWTSLLHHRGLTHSIVVLPFLALAFGWIGWRFGRREGSWLEWSYLAFWAGLSHPLLDVMTVYGTQLLAPIRDDRYGIDALAIVDPAISVPLFLVTWMAFRKKTDRVFSRRAAMIALSVVVAYAAVGWRQSERARAHAEAALRAEGFAPVDVRALPTVGNVLVFRIVARDAGGAFRIGHVSLSAPRPLRFERVAPDRTDVVVRALDSDRGRDFRWFADGMVRAAPDHRPDGAAVVMHDLRFGGFLRPAESFIRARAEFDSGGRLRAVVRDDDYDSDFGAELAALWALIRGG